MLNKVDDVIVEKSRRITELIPLHKLMIQVFPQIEAILIEKLSQLDDNIQKNRLQTKELVDSLLKMSESSGEYKNIQNQKNLNAATNILRAITSIDDIFYEGLPENWESYLRNAVGEITLNMRNKSSHIIAFEDVITNIKRKKKVNFVQIFKRYSEEKAFGYELSKILEDLRVIYSIDFIKIGGTGSVLKIHKIHEKENNIEENLSQIKHILKFSKDSNAFIFNHIINVFEIYIEEIFSKKLLGNFTQDEFVQFAYEKLPFLTISTIRNFTRHLYTKFIGQGLVLKKIPNSFLSRMYFDQKEYNIFINKYFPDINKNDVIQSHLRNFFNSIKGYNTTEAKNCIQFILKKNKDQDFFTIKEYLEKHPKLNKRKVIELFTLLLKNQIIGKYGKDKYYLSNYLIKNDFLNTEEDINILRKRIIELEKKNKSLTENNIQLKQENKNILLENQLLKKDNSEKSPTIESLSKKLEEKKYIATQLGLELGEMRQKFIDLEKKLNSKDNSIHYYQNHAELRQKRIERLLLKITQLETELKTMSESKIKEDIKGIQEKLNETENELMTTKKELQTQQDENKKLNYQLLLVSAGIKPEEKVNNDLPNPVKRKKRLIKKEIKIPPASTYEKQITTIQHSGIMSGLTISGYNNPRILRTLEKILLQIHTLHTFDSNKVQVKSTPEKIEITFFEECMKNFEKQIHFIVEEIQEKSHSEIIIIFGENI